VLKTLQAPDDAIVLKRFSVRDNFVTFRRRSKEIAFLVSVNFSTCGYVQIFNFLSSTGNFFVYQHSSTITHDVSVVRQEVSK